jgi:hypothetical protein
MSLVLAADVPDAISGVLQQTVRMQQTVPGGVAPELLPCGRDPIAVTVIAELI